VNATGTENESAGYQIATDVYEGPLDLLLELIERAELDITQLALAQVTNQYLEYLDHLHQHAAADVSAFLVIAARLLWIKSNALLPHTPITKVFDGEEDPGEALANQLKLYKKFKDLSKFLENQNALGKRTYLRLVSPPRIQAQLDLSDISLDDLVKAGKEILIDRVNLQPLSKVMNMPRITIREKIYSILELISKKGRSSFNAFISPDHSRGEMVITFLALLELIKRRIIEAQQTILFGEIELVSIRKWTENEMDELEFKD
jgi:segregation and condensation protein A